jgi:Ran GTPase-activating protein (RanGAP) involved in mRNA processing and transport
MGIYALASCSHLANLRELRLQFCDVTPLGARYLAEASSLPNLQALDLSHNELGDNAVRALARSRKLPHLRELRLNTCGIGALGVRILLDSGFAGRLTCLDLRNNAIARTQQQALQERFGAGVCIL